MPIDFTLTPELEALRDLRYDGEVAEERQAATDALLMRALRIMLDPRGQD